MARPDLVRQVVDKVRREGLVTTLDKVRTKLDTPIPLGYSCAGQVLDVGPDVEVSRGDRVACAGAGWANHAEYNLVPKNLCVRIPDGVDDEDASFVTLGAIALQGVRQLQPTLGERVVVLGLGLLGLLTVQLLKANGCRVFGFDPARRAGGAGLPARRGRRPARGAGRRRQSLHGRARSRRRDHHGVDQERRAGQHGGRDRTLQGADRRRRLRRHEPQARSLLQEGARPAPVHVVRARTLRPEIRGARPGLPDRLRALDRATQHAGLPRARARWPGHAQGIDLPSLHDPRGGTGLCPARQQRALSRHRPDLSGGSGRGPAPADQDQGRPGASADSAARRRLHRRRQLRPVRAAAAVPRGPQVCALPAWRPRPA